jgi:DNA-binding NtrC family response regulator
MAHSILSVGNDNLLLSVRSSVLRAAGYSVQTCANTSEAFELASAGDFDLVVICHSVPARERSQLIKAIKAEKPSTKILAVRIDGELATGVDASIHSLDGPHALLRAVEAAISK